MAKIVINGIYGLDGEYSFNFKEDPFTNREWRVIKDVSGVRMGEFDEAVEHGDNDLLVALTLIELQRRRIPVVVDQLWDAKMGAITFVGEEEEALPPANGSKLPDGGEPSVTPSDASGDAGPENAPVAIGTSG